MPRPNLKSSMIERGQIVGHDRAFALHPHGSVASKARPTSAGPSRVPVKRSHTPADPEPGETSQRVVAPYMKMMHGPLDKAAIVRGGSRLKYATAEDESSPTSRSLSATAAANAKARGTGRSRTPGRQGVARTRSAGRKGRTPRDPTLGVPSVDEDAVAKAVAGVAARAGQEGSDDGGSNDSSRTMWSQDDVLALKREQKQKVDSLMRSIHKLQDKVKVLKRADKENVRSKLIISLQQTVGEQEVVIRGMIRALADRGWKDEQFREVFKGKKTLRDVDAIETDLRNALKDRDKAQAKLQKLSHQLAGVQGTREQLEMQYEKQFSDANDALASASEMQRELAQARTEASALRARNEAMAAQMQDVELAREALEVESQLRVATVREQEEALGKYRATIEENEEKLAEATMKERQMRAALKAQEKMLTAATAKAAQQGHATPPHPQPPQQQARPAGERGGEVAEEEHDAAMRRLRRAAAADLEAEEERRLKEVRACERKWESRFEAREAEWERAINREREAMQAELQEWKHAAGTGGGEPGGVLAAKGEEGRLRQSMIASRHELEEAHQARTALEADLAKQRQWRQRKEDEEASRSAAAAGLVADLEAELSVVKRKLAAKNVMLQEQQRLEGRSASSLTGALQEAEQRAARLQQRNATLEREATSREARAQAQLATASKSGPALERLRRDYDRLCAAFASKASALAAAQEATEAAHAEFRSQLKQLADKAAEEAAAAAATDKKKKKDADAPEAPGVKELAWNTTRSDFETQIAEMQATMSGLRADVQEQQASADALRAAFYGGAGGGGGGGGGGAAAASDPAIMALTAADFKPVGGGGGSGDDDGAGTGLVADAAGAPAANPNAAMAAAIASGNETGVDGETMVEQNRQFRAGLVELIE